MTAIIIPISASGIRYAEPENRPDIPESAVWDEELGMYVSDDLVKNDSGEYEINWDKFTTDMKYGTYAGGEVLSADDYWYENHKDSQEPVDRVILESIELLGKMPANTGTSSFPEDPFNNTVITSSMKKLDYTSIPELWKRICTEPGCRIQKIVGLELLLSIRIQNNLCNNDNREGWYHQFLELKKEVSSASLDALTVENYGYLAVPVLVDRYENGKSSEAEAALLAAVNEVTPAVGDAKKWLSENRDFITAVRNVLTTDYAWVDD